jgi:enoyl-CoA hydratase/carnithine racemase
MARKKPRYIEFAQKGAIAGLTLDRPEKRNAVNDGMMQELEALLGDLPASVKAVVLAGKGPHFCAGLDLAEHKDRTPFAGMQHSRFWHRVLDQLQFGGRPVIAALAGAVVGGGLEIAAAAHIRVADPTVFYQLPEGKRGIFVGGGASVRVSRLIGAGRVTEMMLTGRSIDADEGQRLGLSHYRVAKGKALAQAMTLAKAVSGNAAISNYLILNALPRIEGMAAEAGLFTESLAAALSQTSDEAQRGIEAFLAKKPARFD